MSYVTTIPDQSRELDYLPRYMMQTPEGQAFISKAIDRGFEIRCICSSSYSSPLVLRSLANDTILLVRRPHTEHEHSARCPHGNVVNTAVAFGMPPRALSLSSGQLLIDLNALFPYLPRAPGGGGGTSSIVTPNFGGHMYSFAMFLLDQAGLLTYGPWNQSVNPWKAFQEAAKSVGVMNAKMTIENCLLLPKGVYGHSSKANFAKLARASERKFSGRGTAGRVLFASVIPPGTAVRTLGNKLELRPSLDVSLTVGPQILARAWHMFGAAQAHHALGRPVLAVGMATVQDKRPEESPKPVIRTQVTQLALIPVGHSLRPTPTSARWQALQTAELGGTTYHV